MDMITFNSTAKNVRSGIDAAMKDTAFTAYSVSLFPAQQRGQISLTVTTDQGRERTLTYLMGQYTNKEVASLSNGPDHDIQVVYDLITVQYIADHVRAWLASA